MARKEIIRKEEDEEKYQQHIPGSCRPRSLSDPLLHFTSSSIRHIRDINDV
jgi:hypothetical protein